MFPASAVQTFNHHENWSFRQQRVLCRFGKIDRSDFDDQDSFAALDLIAVFQRRIFDAPAVNESSIRRIQIAQEGMRRIHFEQAMVAREISIVWQAQVSLRIATDQEGVVLGKRKNAALVRTGYDFQIDLHFGG